MSVALIRCADIVPDPRRNGDEPAEVESLAESVRRHGVIRPVLLCATEDGYVIVHGERRWRAAQMAGLDAIPAFLVQNSMQSASLAA